MVGMRATRSAGTPDFVQPDVGGLVVFGVHRDPEPVGGDLQLVDQKLPRILDRIALEVIAEAEVAQHLEERVMTCGVSDVFEVVVLAAGAQTALAARGTGVGALVLPEEHILELDHPRVREKQRGIVDRNERTRRDHGVPVTLEETQECLANVGGFHRRS